MTNTTRTQPVRGIKRKRYNIEEFTMKRFPVSSPNWRSADIKTFNATRLRAKRETETPTRLIEYKLSVINSIVCRGAFFADAESQTQNVSVASSALPDVTSPQALRALSPHSLATSYLTSFLPLPSAVSVHIAPIVPYWQGGVYPAGIPPLSTAFV